ncbi:MAG: VWA domain-containing protein [bacterium]|nr:VWA domain-containing protein [bacterium]
MAEAPSDPTPAPAGPEIVGGVGSREAFRLPGMSCLVNESGIRVKALVIEKGVRCIDAPADGIRVGSPLRHFQPYFVFDRWPASGSAEYFQIGSTPRPESIVGWAPASTLARWDTRVGVRYARREGARTPPLLVYRDKEPLIELLERGVSDVQPLARANLKADRVLMPWPVAESEQVSVDGRVYGLVRINFLAEIPEGDDPTAAVEERTEVEQVYSAGEVAGIRQRVKMLDIVFCVDNTHSTRPYLDDIRRAVEAISVQLHDLPFQPDLNVGLVLYRDYIDGLYYEPGSVTRHFDLSSDLVGFLHRVQNLEEPSTSSEDYPEAGYDGLLSAVTETSWRGDFSTRAVILIGDNSFHEPGEVRNPRQIGIDRIRREAAERRVKVFTLNIDGKGDDAEQRRHWNQFAAIARATGASCFPIESSNNVVERIHLISETQTAVVKTRDDVTRELAAGLSPDQIAAEHKLDIRQVTEVMEFLAGAGVDVDKLKPGAPTFATGWALVEVPGAQILEREVYVARAEVDLLLSALNMLSSQLYSTTDFGRDAFGASLGGHLGAIGDFYRDQVAEPLDVFLMAKGVPVGRSSVLQLSASEVRHMSEDARTALRERIARSSVPSLVNARNDDALWIFRDDLEFGWIAEEILP